MTGKQDLGRWKGGDIVRIHRNMKIAWNDSAVKLGYFDWCGLPLKTSKRIPKQAFSWSLEGRPV